MVNRTIIDGVVQPAPVSASGSTVSHVFTTAEDWSALSSLGGSKPSSVLVDLTNVTLGAVEVNLDSVASYVVGSGQKDIRGLNPTDAITLSSVVGGGLWDISTITTTDANFLLTGETSAPRGVAISPDGTKMLVTDITSIDSIEEYTLSTPFDPSSASHVDGFAISTTMDNATEISVSPDGLHVYLFGTEAGAGSVAEYLLTAYYDISTASFVRIVNIDSIVPDPVSGCISPTGFKLWVTNATGGATGEIYEFILGTQWDISTAVNIGKLVVSSQDANPLGLAWNPNGTKFFVAGFSGKDINEYVAEKPYSVLSGTFVQAGSLGGTIAPRSLHMSEDGRFAYCIYSTDGKVYRFPSTVTTAFSGTGLSVVSHG